MTLEEFEQSLATDAPAGGTAALQALWWAAKGEWDKAHALVMNDAAGAAAWVHAYLHRVEGDLDNAAYWYRQAGRRPATGSLEDEWRAIARALLAPA